MDVTKENLNILIAKLNGFKHNYSKPIYNPMEQFVDYVSTKEIVHSKIIATLLNPSGEHGLGMDFLLKFLKKILIKVPNISTPNKLNGFEPDISDVKVFTEKTIRNSRRIDILLMAIIGGVKQAIIIENKLNDAVYQPNQLEDYRSEYSNYKTNVVCIHRVDKNEQTPTGADKIIFAHDVANMIDESIKGHQGESIDNLKSYSSYLKNISKQNIIMDNAKIILNSDLTADDFSFIHSLVDAYGQLPRAYAQHLKDMVTQCGYALEASIPTRYDNYCYIWNDDYNNAKPFWVAIGFSQDSVSFYVVSNDKHGWTEVEQSKFAQSLGFEKSSTDQEGTWYKASSDFVLSFQEQGKPDFDVIMKKVKEILAKIHDTKKPS